MSVSSVSLFNFSGDTDATWFSGRLVVTPCLSVANAGQSACESLLQHAKLERVGAVDHDALVPITYAINGGADVALACEVFHAPAAVVTVVQRRSPTQAVRGAARRFAVDLVSTLRNAGARALVLTRKIASLPALAIGDIAIVSNDTTFSRFAHAAATECGLPFVILAVPVAEGVDEALQIRPLVEMLQILL
jgi:hypothetical protein